MDPFTGRGRGDLFPGSRDGDGDVDGDIFTRWRDGDGDRGGDADGDAESFIGEGMRVFCDCGVDGFDVAFMFAVFSQRLLIESGGKVSGCASG